MSNSTTGPSRAWVVPVLLTTLVVASTGGVADVAPANPQPTPVSNCQTVSDAGVYELRSDLTAGEGVCLRIRSSDVTVRGNGRTIDATGGRGTAPVVLAGVADGDLTNVTVTELSLRVSPRPALRYDGVTSGTVADVTVSLTDPSAVGGRVTVAGADTLVRNVTGRLAVVGDGNTVVGGSALGADRTGVVVTGDDNTLRNVTSQGRPALILRGDDNEVSAGSFDGTFDGSGVAVVDGVGSTVANASVRGGPADGRGVAVVNSSGTTVRDTRFRGDLGTGLSVEGSDGSVAVGNRFASDLLFGVRLVDAANNTLRSNVLRSPLYLDEGAGGNLIYDNRLNASRDVFDRNVLFGPLTGASDGPPRPNTWNVSAQSDENVVGGDTVGGNYYANTDGTGFSQTCEDANADGVCDSPNELAANNTDYLPLADPASGTDAPDDGDDGANVTTYQVDFVAGQPIEDLSADSLYAQQDRLFRFAFGNSEEGITDRGSAWANESLRECIDYGHVVSTDGGDTAQVTFTIADGCANTTLSLVVYSLPGETFDADTADQQELLNATSGTYGPGQYTITVDLPDDAEDATSDADA